MRKLYNILHIPTGKYIYPKFIVDMINFNEEYSTKEYLERKMLRIKYISINNNLDFIITFDYKPTGLFSRIILLEVSKEEFDLIEIEDEKI